MFRNNWQRTVCELIRTRNKPADCTECPYWIDRKRMMCVANAHYVVGVGWIRDGKEGEVIDN